MSQHTLQEERLEQVRWVALDLETTGLSPHFDSIIEVGAERFNLAGTIDQRFSALARPSRPIPTRITALTGIADDEVGHCASPEQALQGLLEFLGDEPPALLAHGVAMDLSFVVIQSQRLGSALRPGIAIDTLPLARAAFPTHRDFRLEGLIRFLGDTKEPDEALVFHRAPADAAHTRSLFVECLARLPQLQTVADLERLGALQKWPSPDEPAPKLSPRHAKLLDLIRSETRIEIRYRGGSRRGFRPITPVAIYPRFGRLYLRVHCHLDQCDKDFRLDRITSLKVP